MDQRKKTNRAGQGRNNQRNPGAHCLWALPRKWEESWEIKRTGRVREGTIKTYPSAYWLSALPRKWEESWEIKRTGRVREGTIKTHPGAYWLWALPRK